MNAWMHADTLNMALDALMIAAIAGLWLMWARASRRQREVEALLRNTAEQLDTALAHMEQVMSYIRRIEASQAHAAPAKTGKPSQTGRIMPKEQRVASASGAPESPRPKPASSEQVASTDSASAASLTRVLRLHREGYKAEDIAVRENIPLAKVRLMLKLHDRRAAA